MDAVLPGGDSPPTRCEAVRQQLPEPALQKRLLAMLQLMHERFTEAGVTYWITGGTLLGALRHGGFIPHDDDVDIEILEEHLPRAMEALGKVGRAFRHGGKWQGSDVDMGRFMWWGEDKRFSSFVDAFVRREPLEELAEFPSAEEVFPLERLAFNGISVMAPNRQGAESFLKRCYGSNCLEEVVVWSHSCQSRSLLQFSLAEYSTAVEAAGYVAPFLEGSAAESLEAMGLSCPGELNEELWRDLGWASAVPLACDGLEGPDHNVLEVLGFHAKTWEVKGDLEVGALRELQALGAHLSLKPGGLLEAVGSETELEAVEAALNAFRVEAC